MNYQPPQCTGILALAGIVSAAAALYHNYGTQLSATAAGNALAYLLSLAIVSAAAALYLN